MTGRSWLATLMVSLLVLASAARPGVARASGGPDTGATFPGIYGSPGVLVAGGPDGARIRANVDCPTTAEVLVAGDWTETGRYATPQQDPKAAGGELWLQLVRGPERAFARLVGSRDMCSGTIQRTPSLPFRVTGATPMDVTARLLPRMCTTLPDGSVAIEGFIDIDGGWLSRVSLGVVPAIGTRSLPWASVTSGDFFVRHLDKPLFDLLAHPPKGGVDDQSGVLAPGPRYAGSVRVDDIAPLTGSVSLQGLLDAKGRSADVMLGFACQPAVAPSGPDDVAGPPSVALDASVLDAVRIKGSYGVRADTTVQMTAALDRVTGPRYEGHATVSANGTFSEFSSSGRGRCTGRWTGTQDVDLVGVASGATWSLSIAPTSPPTTTWVKPCNVDSHASDGTFPWSGLLSGSITVAWPPAAAGVAPQVMKTKTKGIGSTTWTVGLTGVP